jgi:hypothetical protein
MSETAGSGTLAVQLHRTMLSAAVPLTRHHYSALSSTTRGDSIIRQAFAIPTRAKLCAGLRVIDRKRRSG